MATPLIGTPLLNNLLAAPVPPDPYQSGVSTPAGDPFAAGGSGVAPAPVAIPNPYTLSAPGLQSPVLRPVDPGAPVLPPIALQPPARQANGVASASADPAKSPNGINADEANAHGVIQHLLAALGNVKDQNLKGTLSTALAALHKHVAGIQKERQDALQGKFSPRIMEQAAANAGGAMLPAGAPAQGQQIDTGYNPAKFQLSQGNTAQAAADWEAHHPYAMAHNQGLPGWLTSYLASQLHPAVNPATAAAAHTTAPANAPSAL